LTESRSICRKLEWDSSFFGYNIALVNAERLTDATAAEVRNWCHENRIDCLYFLADASDPATVRVAEDNGFRFLDVRLTLGTTIGEIPSSRLPGGTIRFGKPADANVLRSIASQSHRDSRFYYDPYFSRSQCDALYQTWIEKSLNGYAEAVLVAEYNDELVGYLSCHTHSPGKGEIGLFAVRSKAQGKGLGHGLVSESLRWFSANGRSQVTVVTQGRNVPSQRVYQRCGFQTKLVQLWYHAWFSRDRQTGT